MQPAWATIQILGGRIFGATEALQVDRVKDVVALVSGIAVEESRGYGRSTSLPHVGLLLEPARTFAAEAADGPAPDSFEAQARETVDAVDADIQACYATALAKSPDLQGRLDVQFAVGPDGRVVSARRVGGTLASSSVESCVLAKVQMLEFPKPEKVEVLRMPFEFGTL